MPIDRTTTLVLSVGGNDFYPRGNRPSPDGYGIHREFEELLKLAKSKTNKIVVVGLVPRRGFRFEMYMRARGLNDYLNDLCLQYSLKFAKPWDLLFGRDRMFQQDGIHFSEEGAKTFSRFLVSRLFKPVKVTQGSVADGLHQRPSRDIPARVVRARPQSRVVRTESQEPATLGRPEEVMDGPGPLTSEAPKRQRSPGTAPGCTPSPQQRQKKRRNSWSGRRSSENGHRGGDPPTPGNGSPSTTAMNP